jgi:hypothetical protein
MPPSGYNAEQATYLTTFLKSCASELLREAEEERSSIENKLSREISDIDGYLADGCATHPASRSVLEMTKAFYNEILVLTPFDALTFWCAVESALENIRVSVLGIHITPELKSRYAAWRTAAE